MFCNVAYSLITAPSAVQAIGSDDDGLTFAEVITNIPHDPASIFAYVLLAGMLGSIVWFGRRRVPRPPERMS